MSVCNIYYMIIGYDITNYMTDQFATWKWTESGEKYLYNQTSGCVQLFDDPMNGAYVYFGYVLASGDLYEFNTTKISPFDLQEEINQVAVELCKLVDYGVVRERVFDDCVYNIIFFKECS